jgi:hypothetical protein
MGTCKYCGGDAGMLRSVHAACADKLRSSIVSYLGGQSELVALDSTAGELNAKGAAGADVFLDSWDGAVARALDDGVLTLDEEHRLTSAAQLFGLGQAELDRKGKYTQIVKAAVLRDVLEGKVPERVKIEGLGVNLQKSEKIAWVFQGAEYQTLKTYRSYSGMSHGLSIRVMRGVYYRPSVFKGAPSEHSQVVSGGKGPLALTNKHLYFLGQLKTLRIPYAKVVAFQPYSDGIGLQRDAASAKPEIFKTGDGWFTYNLVTNLAQL